MDPLAPEVRSLVMSKVRAQHTTPELIVRRIVHAMGYRFRLHRRDLPGCPDVVLPRLGAVILVHGCFWHRHTCPRGRSEPSTRPAFWRAKFTANASRDRRAIRALRRKGWRVLVVWECQTRDIDRLEKRIKKFLDTEVSSD